MNNIMMDIETLDTRHTALVLSIGLARFDKTGVKSAMYFVMQHEDQEEMGRTISEATVAWWNKQSDTAKQVITDCRENPIETHHSLLLVKDWMGVDPIVWGNGADFDNAIVASLYHDFETEVPWKHWNSRCYRTLKNLCPQTVIDHMPARRGTHHNALDDAIYQAECAIQLLKFIQGA